jgi:hypothetical protein
MSVDWNIVCDKCKEWHHLGQDMGGICSFGYDSKDIEGRLAAGEFISEHLGHNWDEGEFLRIMKTDNLPNGYTEKASLKKDQYGHMWIDRGKAVCPFICKNCGALSGTDDAFQNCLP